MNTFRKLLIVTIIQDLLFSFIAFGCSAVKFRYLVHEKSLVI